MQDGLLVEDNQFFDAMRHDTTNQVCNRSRLCLPPQPIGTSRSSEVESSPNRYRSAFDRYPDPPDER
jgi:hypothetical protein